MKKIIKLGTILFVSSLFIFGCAKDNSQKNTKVSNKELLSILPKDFYEPSADAKNITSQDDILDLIDALNYDLGSNFEFAAEELMYGDNSLDSAVNSIMSDIESAITKAENTGRLKYSIDMQDKNIGNENSVVINVNKLNANIKSANLEKDDIEANISANIEAAFNGSSLPEVENPYYWYDESEEENKENYIKALKTKITLDGNGSGDLSLDNLTGTIAANIGVGLLFDTGDLNGIMNINLAVSSENLSYLADSIEVFIYKLGDLAYECSSEEEFIEKIATKVDNFPVELNLSITFTDVKGKNKFEFVNITKPSQLLEQTDLADILEDYI